VLRFLARVFVEIFVDLLVKGPGYLICRVVGKDVDPDGVQALLAGFGFWVVTGATLYAAYGYLAG
jgi:hypothetical protein